MHCVRRLDHFGRLGFAAHGLVYLLVGWFAIRAAVGGGSPTDSKGALQNLVGGPLGTVLLLAIAGGLLCYALFRLIEAGLDLENHGRGAKGLAVRGGIVISALLRVALAAYAVSLAAGVGFGGSGGGGAEDWTAWLMAQPFGRWLVVAVGLGVLATGVMQLRIAWQASFMDSLELDSAHHSWVKPVGRIGFVARSVVFALIGAFLLSAGWFADPNEAGGLDAALRKMQQQEQGPWLLGLVAVGLLLFGIYCFVEAAYRRITSLDMVARLHAAAS